MQQFIAEGVGHASHASEGAWDDEVILKQHWQEVDKDLGEEDGILILDESDFLKQGTESVGVKRQYCGEVGKVANCQAGVYLGYVSTKGYTLLSRRLYLPEEWVFDSSYAEGVRSFGRIAPREARRKKCGVPKDIKFMRGRRCDECRNRTAAKPALGFEMIKAVYEEGTLRCRWVTCDESFGRDTSFLDDIASLGLWYYAEVPIDTKAWEKLPVTVVPEWSRHGRKPTQKRLVEGEPDAKTVVALAQTLAEKDWSLTTIKEGSKGPIIADFACLRVIAVRDGLPGDEVWLIFRRDVFTGELKAYLSNAPCDIPFETLVRISSGRWKSLSIDKNEIMRPIYHIESGD
jgi:SRSO17 transposase